MTLTGWKRTQQLQIKLNYLTECEIFWECFHWLLFTNLPQRHSKLTMEFSPSLERELEERIDRDRDAEFLWPRYKAMKDYLELNYYRWVQANCPFFTDHGEQHIKAVIQAASSLLRPFLLPPKKQGLRSMDIFLILSAIIWHDAAMVLGRAGHAVNISKLTDKISALGFTDTTVRRLVTEIARAHTGRTGLDLPRPEEDITTQEMTHTVYSRALAAIVRFADEVSENRSRISLPLLDQIPEDKKIYWHYAASIVASHPEPERERVVVTVEFELDSVIRRFQCDPNFSHRADDSGRLTLLEYVLCRLEKMNNELIYCRTHMSRFTTLQEIEVRLTIVRREVRLKGYDNLTIVLGAAGLNKYPNVPLFAEFFQQHPEWKPDELKKVV